jgi:CheY-like chemotaxis protein
MNDTPGAGRRILLVDDDRTILRLLTVTLQKRGYEVVTAADGEQGLEAAKSARPHLVISDVMMPNVDGWTFIKRLRSLPEFAMVPVIFLTALDSSENRILGFRLGADDYMPKPISPEELGLRVAKALRQGSQLQTTMVEQTRRAPAFQGTLDQVGLPSLLTLLEMERKSGVLHLAGRGGEGARLVLRDGHIVWARFDGRESPRNEAAVYALLCWTAGSFEFDASGQGQAVPVEIHASTTYLLLEGARLSDEAGRDEGHGLVDDVFGRED